MASGGVDSLFTNEGYAPIAASVICCWDYLVTFDDEVRYIWGRRISGISVLFVLSRYAMICASLVSIVQVLPWGFNLGIYSEAGPTGSDNQICSAAVHIIDICFVISNIAYAAFAALRIFALYGLNKSLFALVLFVGFLNPSTQIFLMAIDATGANASDKPLESIRHLIPVGRLDCYHDVGAAANALFGRRNMLWVMDLIFPALRIHSLIFESMLIVLTWRKTLTRWSLQKTIIRTPFTTMLLRNGTMYFVIIAATSLLNLIGMLVYLISKDPNVYNNVGVVAIAATGPLVDVITSVCMSRFILNLLSVRLDDGNTQCPTSQCRTSQWMTLQFATDGDTIAGSMGRSTKDTSWSDGETDITDSVGDVRTVAHDIGVGDEA